MKESRENDMLEQTVEETEKERETSAAEESNAGAKPTPATPPNENGEKDQAQPSVDPSQAKPETEKQEVKSPEAVIAELNEKVLRMQADFDNFRKRILKEREESLRYANEGLLEQLLPILDNFELGLQAAETATDAAAIAQGMSMVKEQLRRFLEDFGVQEITAGSGEFDPHIHEAVSQEASEEIPEGHIICQRRKGYKLKDRLLRAACVVVAKASAPKDKA